MNDRTDIAREMISLLRDTSPAGNHSDVSPDSPLGEQGLGLDSLALVKFITAVENQFDIEIPDEIWIDRGRLTLDDVIDVVAELQSPDLTATRRIEIQPAELAALSPRKKAATVIQKRGVFRAVGWMARRIMQRLLRTIYEKSVFYVLAFDLTDQALPSYTPPVEITFGTATLDDTDAVRGIWPDRQASRKLASFRKRLNAGVTCYTATVDSTIASAKKNGYVTTLFNRIRYLPEINAKNFQVRQFAERTAINTPIQGTAADMIKVAMIDVHKQMTKMKSKMILQVHDELVFDVHEDELDDLKMIVKNGMEKAVKLKVPIVVDMGIGPNWLEAK